MNDSVAVASKNSTGPGIPEAMLMSVHVCMPVCEQYGQDTDCKYRIDASSDKSDTQDELRMWPKRNRWTRPIQPHVSIGVWSCDQSNATKYSPTSGLARHWCLDSLLGKLSFSRSVGSRR